MRATPICDTIDAQLAADYAGLNADKDRYIEGMSRFRAAAQDMERDRAELVEALRVVIADHCSILSPNSDRKSIKSARALLERMKP